MRPLPLAACVVASLTACTAVGAWLYDDPSFSLRSVTLRRGAEMGQGASDSLELQFMGCNRNDYDLLSERFQARLTVAGMAAVAGAREQPVFLGTRDTSSFVITVPVKGEELEARGKPRRFEVAGQSVVRTPIGNRPVQFRLRGQVESGASGLRWVGAFGLACRPGVTALPGIFDRRAPLSGEEDTTRARPPIYTEDPNRPGQPVQPGQPGPGGRPQR